MTTVADTDQPTTPEPDPGTYALVELFGHRQVAGRVSEVQRYGNPMLRVDVPATPGKPATTHYYGGSAVFGEHPVDEATAHKLAVQIYRGPADPWAIEPRRTDDLDEYDDPDPDDDGPF